MKALVKFSKVLDEDVKSLGNFYMTWSLMFEVCQHCVSMENYGALFST